MIKNNERQANIIKKEQTSCLLFSSKSKMILKNYKLQRRKATSQE